MLSVCAALSVTPRPQVYGATLADRLIQDHGGKGWLVLDATVFEEANAAVTDSENSSELQEDQIMQGLITAHSLSTTHVRSDMHNTRHTDRQSLY